MSNDVIAQLIGVIAVCISLSVYQSNKRPHMLKLVMAATLLYVVHFYLIGAFTGAAMNFVAFFGSYMFYKVKSRHWFILVPLIAMQISAAVLTWQGILSLLPLFGSICGGFALWHKKPRQIRRWALVGSPLWFTYNAISGSYPGMLIETINVCSNLIGQHRFDHRHVHGAKKIR